MGEVKALREQGFRKASRQGRKARISIQGPSGSGKTTTALRLARGLAPEGRVAVIDAENGRSEMESDRIVGGFDVSVLVRATAEAFIEAMHAAARAGYEVIILDSISAEWEQILAEKDRQPEKEKFTGWGKLTPKHDAFLSAISNYPGHVIVTVRSKVKYVLQQVEKKGRLVNEPVKLGMEPIARSGTEYEFDLAFELDHASTCWLNKRPRGAFGFTADDSWREPGEELGAQIAAGLGQAPERAAEVAAPDEPTTSSESASEAGAASGSMPRWALTAEQSIARVLGQVDPEDLRPLFGGELPSKDVFAAAALTLRGRDDTAALYRSLRDLAKRTANA